MVQPAKASKRSPRKAKSVARTAKKAPKLAAAANKGMSAAHKEALAMGRDEGRAVRNYLEALEAHKPKRGRKRTVEGIQRRLDQISRDLPYADPLTRVHLAQEQMNLQAELETGPGVADLSPLEDEFVKAAKGYSERKGLSYAAWREVGINPSVLKRAGIPRTRN